MAGSSCIFKRGNLFNKKGVAKYTNSKCEIHLGNGKRLDTYIPGEKIISRKATDLDQIEESTWRNYCNELITKYKKEEHRSSHQKCQENLL